MARVPLHPAVSALTTHRLLTADDPLFAPCWAMYEASFPPEERRPLADQRAAMAGQGRQDFHCLAFCEGGELVGLCFCWRAADFLYVEHLAVAPARRGQGLGHRILAQVAAMGLPLILEIEPVADAATERRWRFYRSAGFHRLPVEHMQLVYRPGDAPLPLELLSYPQAMGAGELAAFECYLHGQVARYTCLPVKRLAPNRRAT